VRLVVQRVVRAAVTVEELLIGEIGGGALVLVGVSPDDTVELADQMADKLLTLRYFGDAQGRTNLDLRAVDGELLVVSQFTLYADLRAGRRPVFTAAARPEVAEPIVERFADRLRDQGIKVATGRFGAEMAVELVNDGPFTLIMDSDHDAGAGPR
jgi:D-tyrosyl-tRNA(Tyr) deacylase